MDFNTMVNLSCCPLEVGNQIVYNLTKITPYGGNTDNGNTCLESYYLHHQRLGYISWNQMKWLIDSGILNFSGRTMVFCEAYIMVIWTHKHFFEGGNRFKRASYHYLFQYICGTVFQTLPLEVKLFILLHSSMIALDIVIFFLSKYKSEDFIAGHMFY